MKSFIAFVALAAIIGAQAASLSDEQKEKLVNYNKECLEKSGANKEQIDSAKKGTFADDSKFKAHLFCVSQKIGSQNAAGELQKDVIITKLTSVLNDKPAVEKIYEKCSATAADTPEQTAYNVFKCYYENTPEHVSFV